MGIVNITPDSFYDGGQHFKFDAALRLVEQMVAEGVDYIDVGGESTRPNAAPVSEMQECDRVLPVIESVRARFDVSISVDTSRPAVMRSACLAGATLINDVRALQVEGALAAAAESDADVCLMHMLGEPGTMQDDPVYDDVVKSVRDFLETRAAACRAVGIAESRVTVDPGIGFGKTLAHNLRLLGRLDQIAPAQTPVVLGVSRKSMFGQLLGRAADDRLYASLAAVVDAARRGVAMVRVHDVGPTVDALKVWWAVNKENQCRRGLLE
jgi:dihydropteroate synthase